ncbi:MAG: hypothetical protein IJ190_02790 [Prevotella sp.]|nr:hypothetical protein [Prevotella sp.]
MAFLTGCSSEDAASLVTQPPEVRTWDVAVDATGESVEDIEDLSSSIRAIFYGGNNGHRFYFIWDTGDKVDVYKGDTKLGTLTPSKYGNETTTLTGTLTGAIAVSDVLKLYLPSRAYDYTGQDATMKMLSSKYAFQESSTTVVEAKAAGNTLSLTTAAMTHAQTYWWLRMTDENDARLHPTRIQIYGTGGKMVKTKAVDGTTTYFTEADPMDIIIGKEEDNGEYPGEAFIAIRNEKGSADTYKFKVWVGEDVYLGPSNRALTYAVTNGNMDNVMRQMRKVTSASTLTIAAIPDQTFTGYAIEPVLTVKDGDDVLTLGTDYSVAYTSNVNVGEATATITGLADAGDVVATKYLGTQPKAFNIVRATPVIEMSTATMEIVAGHSGQTRAVTRVFIDNNGNGTWDEGTDYDITALCSVTYASDNTGVATVNASTGAVSPAASPTEPTTATITATVAAATNWNSQSLSYTVNVETEVNTENEVNSWGNGGSDSDKIYVE